MLTKYNGDKAGFVISPNLVAAVEESGNIVLRTPERVVTITDVDHLIDVLISARRIRDERPEEVRVIPTYQSADAPGITAPTWGPWGEDGRPGA